MISVTLLCPECKNRNSHSPRLLGEISYFYGEIKMSSLLEQLKTMTTIVADTGDIEAIRSWKPEDATTNPSLLFKATSLPEYVSLIHISEPTRRTPISY